MLDPEERPSQRKGLPQSDRCDIPAGRGRRLQSAESLPEELHTVCKRDHSESARSDAA